MIDPTEPTTTEAAAPDTAPVETTAAPAVETPTPEQAKDATVDAALAAMLAEAPKAGDPPAPSAPAATDPQAPAADPVAKVGEAAPVKPDAPAADKLADTFEEELAAAGPVTKRQEARMKQLYERARKADELAPMADRLRDWEDTITSTGATPEQFGGAMNYLTLLNSGKPENLEIAFEQIEGEYLALAKALGRPTSAGYDPIADHPDIAAKLANMDIDRDTALELIAARNRAKVEQASRQTQQQQDSQQDGIAQGRNALAALETELRVTDPAYAEKLKVLAPALQAMTQTSAPDQWATAARRMFATLNIPAPTAPVTKLPGATPLRPTVPGGSHAKPVTDPVDGAFAAMLAGNR